MYWRPLRKGTTKLKVERQHGTETVLADNIRFRVDDDARMLDLSVDVKDSADDGLGDFKSLKTDDRVIFDHLNKILKHVRFGVPAVWRCMWRRRGTIGSRCVSRPIRQIHRSRFTWSPFFRTIRHCDPEIQRVIDTPEALNEPVGQSSVRFPSGGNMHRFVALTIVVAAAVAAPSLAQESAARKNVVALQCDLTKDGQVVARPSFRTESGVTARFRFETNLRWR
jgi:hypothetical protein